MQKNSNLNNHPSQNEMAELESLFKQNELDKLEKKNWEVDLYLSKNSNSL